MKNTFSTFFAEAPSPFVHLLVQCYHFGLNTDLILCKCLSLSAIDKTSQPTWQDAPWTGRLLDAIRPLLSISDGLFYVICPHDVQHCWLQPSFLLAVHPFRRMVKKSVWLKMLVKLYSHTFSAVVLFYCLHSLFTSTSNRLHASKSQRKSRTIYVFPLADVSQFSSNNCYDRFTLAYYLY